MLEFDPTAKFKTSFFQECDELLLEVEQNIAGLRRGDAEALNALFRTVHTVKGGAGMFAFNRLVGFAHLLENVLDRLRDGSLEPNDSVVDGVLKSCDVLADLVQDAKRVVSLPDAHEAAMSEQLERLAGTLVEETTGAAQQPSLQSSFVIRFVPEPGLFKRGCEPQLIFRELADLGTVKVVADVSRLPVFDDLDPFACHLGWTIGLKTSEPIERVRSVFEFVEGSSAVEVMPDRRKAERPTQRLAAAEGLTAVQAMSSIRVDLERIDKLVNQVGEIAIVQSMLDQHADDDLHVTHPQLDQAVRQLSQLIQGLQDSVMAIRAVPVGSVFARMTRLVRDLSAATGKQVMLNCSGEETEIDKTVIEQLGDPLLHMIRNAIDHGIERPDEREAAGKHATGRIDLTARQRGGQIVIEVIDDGRGLDHKKIRRKAIEKGLIAEAAILTEEEAINLVFQPGFSTAESISDISGRGVGMDVVKRNIQKLGGRVTIRSEAGQGSRVMIALPLTLAILSGMIVRSGSGFYVFPLSNIVECMHAKPGQIKRLPDLGEMFNFRESYVPLIRLGAVFNTASSAVGDEPLIIVVDDEDGNTIGVAVDEIAGQQQVVIKSLRDNLDDVYGISGATILGDGTVALILILSDLLTLHKDRVVSGFRVRTPQNNLLEPLQSTA